MWGRKTVVLGMVVGVGLVGCVDVERQASPMAALDGGGGLVLSDEPDAVPDVPPDAASPDLEPADSGPEVPDEPSPRAPVCPEGWVCTSITCGVDADCDDEQGCTLDRCTDKGTCRFAVTDGATCDDGDPCTFADQCTGGACVGSAAPCEDGELGCVETACDGAGGCTQTQKPGSCLIDGTCYGAGAASAASVCLRCSPVHSPTDWTVASDAACDDGDPCTLADECSTGGACLGQAFECASAGWCDLASCTGSGCANTVAPESCLIDGACYTAGAVNPDEPCLVCDPTSPTAWTAAAEGQACGYGQGCPSTGICSSGVCEGASKPCDDGISCTLDSCSGGGCMHAVAQGFCLIDGQCLSEGEGHPDNPCLACDDDNPTGWSPSPGGCDDGNACTEGDVCVAGDCASGAPVDCDDGIACTLDTCLPGGACEHTAPADSCLIDGVCYAEGALAPGNPCLVCDPALPSTWSWSTEPCDDGDLCTGGDVCKFGACSGTPIEDAHDDVALNDWSSQATWLGEAYSGDNFPEDSTQAFLYPQADQDWFAWKIVDDLAGNAEPRVDVHSLPAGTYQVCLYFECDSGSTNLSCKDGDSSAVTNYGMKGCCSPEVSYSTSVRLNPGCGGLSNASGTAFAHVRQLTGDAQCNFYGLKWGDD